MKLLATSKSKRDPRTPEVPTIEELAPAGKKNFLNALYTAENIGRAIVLPPGVPAERVKSLRDGFAELAQDSRFRDEAEKLGIETGSIRGEEMNRLVEATVRDKVLMEVYRKIVMAP